MISKCKGTCVSKYQDEKYGASMRVFTPSTQHDGDQHHCTVCGDSKDIVKRKGG